MKIKRLFIFLVFTLVISLFFTSTVYAASKYYMSVGTNYGSIGGDGTPEANWVGGTLALKQYIGTTVTQPKYLNFNSQYQGRYTLESDVLYFLGHGSSSNISWNYQAKNGDYAVGITYDATDKTYYGTDSARTPYRMTGIGKYNLGKVKLAVFQGCGTAEDPNNNLPKYAVSRGANVAVGWSTQIHQSDSLPWIKRFFSNGFLPNNVTNMVNYANSFSYYTTAIKNTRVYGNGGSSVFPSSLMPINQFSTVIDQRRHIINEKINTNDFSDQELSVMKEKISKIIISNINSNFLSEDYTIEKAQNNNGKIYDLYFTVNNVKTNLGYTIFTNVDGTMITEIYDNMNGYDNIELKNSKTKMVQQKLDKLNASTSQIINKKALQNTMNEGIKQTIEGSFNYYNIDENKVYHIVQVKAELSPGTYSILDYKEEL